MHRRSYDYRSSAENRAEAWIGRIAELIAHDSSPLGELLDLRQAFAQAKRQKGEIFRHPGRFQSLILQT